MQEEHLRIIKLDASSRHAGALKGEAIVHYAEPLITKGAVSAARRVMIASGSLSLRLAAEGLKQGVKRHLPFNCILTR